MFWKLQLQFYMQVVVNDRTFHSDELLLSGLAQMTELFSAEHRTFFVLHSMQIMAGQTLDFITDP